MVGTDIYQCLADHIQQCRINGVISFLDLFFCNADGVLIDFYLVKLLCIGEKGFVPFTFYLCQNFCYCRFKFSVIIRASFQQISQNISGRFFG